MFFSKLSSQALYFFVSTYLLAASGINALAISDHSIGVEKRSVGPLKIDFNVPRDDFILVNGTDGLEFFNIKDETRTKVGKRAEYHSDKRAEYHADKRAEFHADKRSVLAPLHNEGIYYSTDIYVGSNRQHLEVEVDTGSSDLWIPASNDKCNSCNEYGSFNPTESNTFKNLSEPFHIWYEDKSSALGTFVTDDLAFSSDGSPTIDALQFALASHTSQNRGILGIGIEQQEFASSEYPNTPFALANQGIIDKASYSIYLNSQDATTGTILFGGIDTDKFDGDLVKLPYTEEVNNRVAQYVQLNSVQYEDGSTLSINSPVVLDSGTTFTYLPKDSFEAVGDKLGGQLEGASNNLHYLIDCDFRNKEGHLTFEFSGISIKVPYSDLVANLYDSNNQFTGQCALAIFNFNDINILGDNFLRHAYVYYDLQDKYVAIQQVKYSSSSSIESA